ncbi:MAG: glycosyltransferase family 2 protein [Opitutales bacterium]|nr:glycosyltransferase family 2 protein [Opitutales bacterium]
MEKITIGVINYNGIERLPNTLEAITKLDYLNFEVIVVDNGSTDNSPEWVKEKYPQFQLVLIGENLGPSGARNVILTRAKSEYVFVMDNDIILEPDVFTRLMSVMGKCPDAAICHPEITDANDPQVHHYNGGWIHYLCTFISRLEPEPGAIRPEWEQFDVTSGGALLIRRELARELGNFDEDYFFNWEDGDFVSRANLSGYSCLNVPGAIVHHMSKPRGTSKVFYQTRNRWYFILKLYSWRTILLITPALLLFEISLAMLLLLKGSFLEYMRGNFAVFKNFRQIMLKRKAFMTLKKVDDRDWLKSGSMYVPEEIAGNTLLKMIAESFYKLFDVYWLLVRKLL